MLGMLAYLKNMYHIVATYLHLYILNALCPNIQKSWRETEHLKIKIDILICMISNSFFLKAIIKVTDNCDISNIYGKNCFKFSTSK